MSVGEVEIVVRKFGLPIEDEVAKFSAAWPPVAATLRTTRAKTLLADWNNGVMDSSSEGCGFKAWSWQIFSNNANNSLVFGRWPQAKNSDFHLEMGDKRKASYDVKKSLSLEFLLTHLH